MLTKTRSLLLGAVILVVVLATGCDRLGIGYTSIRDIAQKPSAYEGKTVKVRGEVSDVVQVPVAGLRYYTLRDGDAELFVVPSENVPAMGERTSVTGVVSSIAVVGGTSIGLHLTEERRW